MNSRQNLQKRRNRRKRQLYWESKQPSIVVALAATIHKEEDGKYKFKWRI